MAVPVRSGEDREYRRPIDVTDHLTDVYNIIMFLLEEELYGPMHTFAEATHPLEWDAFNHTVFQC